MAQSLGTAVSFDAKKIYSQWAIDSRLNDFYANTTQMGFGVFDDKGNVLADANLPKTTLDYVPGLVAKAVLEAVDYYKDSKIIDVKPWFYAVQNYGCSCYVSDNGKAGKSFDDLNAVKLYSLLYRFSQDKTFPDPAGSLYTNNEAANSSFVAFNDALAGISTANSQYVITRSTNTKAAGGWWHKSSYDNQMWCDGQYMGPALLAQIINDFPGYWNISDDDWGLVINQFDISWNYLWNPTDKLLYHAFSATPKANSSSCWATLKCSYDNTCSTNTAYWGRADAWYMFALVDVLEQMQRSVDYKYLVDDYNRLRGYLNSLAEGVAARQDASGCWYQLLDKTASYSSGGKKNYLESSCSAIFIAAYLKAMRLGLLDTDYTSLCKKAYEGFVNNFLVADGKGGVHIINSCRSAGLGGWTMRDGTPSYYLTGSDVSYTMAKEGQTEGKVLGAFIMAATEYERAFVDAASTSIRNNTKISITNSQLYNLCGQRAGKDATGVVIDNGTKRLLKR